MSVPASAAQDAALPTIPRNWRWMTVREAGEVKLGRQRSPEHHNGPHMRPYLRVANVYEDRIDLSDVLSMNFTPEEFEIYRLRRGDILLNEGQSLEWVGRPAMFRDDLPGACFQNTLVRFRPNPFVDSAFALFVFRHYLHSRRFQKIAKWTVNIAHLGAQRFAEIEFPVPPLPEQRRIVAKIEELFSDLDAGVAALERVRANLKRYRAAVLKAAVEGRLTEEWRKQNPVAPKDTAAKLLERILLDRRAKWEQDQLRKFKEAGKTPPKGWKEKYEEPPAPNAAGLFGIPNSWQWAGALQLCERVDSGSTPAPHLMSQGSGEVPFIKVYNLTFDGRLDFSIKPTFVSRETHTTRLRRSRTVPGDVLMNIVGPPLGKVSIVPNAYPEWNTNQAVVNFRPSAGITNRYLCICLLAEPVLRWIISQAKATAGQHNISVSMSRDLPLPLAPLAEQSAIVAEVDRRLSVADAAEQQVEHALQRAARLRQSILKRAFEGRLVPEDSNDGPVACPIRRKARARGSSRGHVHA